nr:12183_t:CDS:1 [Entrophospora candida]
MKSFKTILNLLLIFFFALKLSSTNAFPNLANKRSPSALAASTTTPQTKIRSVLNNKDDRNKRKRDYLLQKRQCLGGAPCDECCTAAVLPPPISPCGGPLPCGVGPCGGTCGSGSCKTPTVYSNNCGGHNEYQGSYDNCNQLQSCDETQQQVCYDNCQESQYNLMM